MVMVPACTCLSRTWFWPRGLQSAYVHINKRPGSACKEGQTGFYLWCYSSSSYHLENPRWCSHQVLRLEDYLLDSCGSAGVRDQASMV